MAVSQHCVNYFLWLYASMANRKAQDQDKYILRLPDGMRDRIRAAAESNGRSMNAEIVQTLEDKYPEPKPLVGYDQIVADVLADGKPRVLKRDDAEIHFSKHTDGRVILDVLSRRKLRSPGEPTD